MCDDEYSPSDYIPFEELEIPGSFGCLLLRLKKVRAGYVLEHSQRPQRGIAQSVKACFDDVSGLKGYLSAPEFAGAGAAVAALVAKVSGRTA